jgi:hypothetical protein
MVKKNTNKINDLFRDSIGEAKKVRRSVYLPTDLLEKLEKVANETGRSTNKVIERILMDWFEGG